jgi:hypothetical protein
MWQDRTNRPISLGRYAARLRQTACALLLLLVLGPLAVPLAYAEGAQLISARIEQTEDGYQLSADFEIQLANTLLETIRKGVPLYFVVDFELTRGRWYWLDDSVVRLGRERRVSYAPLTEQFRISTAGISQNLSNADDIKRILSRIRSWTIADRGKLKPGEKLEAAIRFRLDTAQLPKPFQLNTIGSREWNLSSDWHRWTIMIGRDGSVSP